MTYCTELLGAPYADWFDRAAQAWNAFGLVKLERVAQSAGCAILPYFVESLPGNEIGLTQEPVDATPGVTTLTSQYTAARAWDEATFTETAAHEIGHALGLDHNDNPQSVMTPELNRVVSGPTAVDRATLARIYPEAVPADPAPADPAAPAGAMPIGQIGRGIVQVPTPEGVLNLGVTYLPAVAAASAGPPPDGSMVIAFQPSKAVAVVQFIGLSPLPAPEGPAPAAPASEPPPAPAPAAPAQPALQTVPPVPVPEVSPMGPLVLLLTSSLRAEFAHLLAEQLQAGAPLDVAAKTVAAAIEAKTPAGPLRDIETAVLDALIKVVENVAAAAAPPAAPAPAGN